MRKLRKTRSFDPPWVTQRMLDAHLADVDWRLRALRINVNSPVREVFDFEKDQILWDK